ncbi:hypothetical protein PR048_005328 [Dryococelus australis]|uniref:Uncharacterized protein n=1 Tax=Dryococelus australis TaxID=614101 RepID=A0ABQ9I8E9_9NEOP|nr:hypothetical protein PR048_005328 [Dryococelus australis]
MASKLKRSCNRDNQGCTKCQVLSMFESQAKHKQLIEVKQHCSFHKFCTWQKRKKSKLFSNSSPKINTASAFSGLYETLQQEMHDGTNQFCCANLQKFVKVL